MNFAKRHSVGPWRWALLVFGGLGWLACGGNGARRDYTHLGVLAGAVDGQSVSGTVRLNKTEDALTGRVRLSSGGELAFTSDGGPMSVDGRTAFLVDTGSGTMAGFQFYSPGDGGPEQFIGTFGGDGGLTGMARGAAASDDTRLYCGSFSGAAAGVWNFSISQGLLVGAYSGFDGTLTVQGYLGGSRTGNDVSIVWSQLFANGTASGQFGAGGDTVAGSWDGYRDGGSWSSSESCPSF